MKAEEAMSVCSMVFHKVQIAFNSIEWKGNISEGRDRMDTFNAKWKMIHCCFAMAFLLPVNNDVLSFE